MTLRRAAGLSGRAAAAACGWNQAKVSRMETGAVRPTVADVDLLLDLYQASDGPRDRVHELVAASQTVDRTWRSLHKGGMRHRQEELAALLATACRVVHFQPCWIPGLLQTAEYARCVLELADWTGQRDLDAAVGARLARQRVLFEHGAPEYDFVLQEAALRWRPAGPWSILLAQLSRVATLAELPNITLRVIPWTAPMTALGSHSFVAYRFRDRGEPPRVHIETIGGELTITGEDECNPYWETHARLSQAALSPEDSTRFVKDLARSLPVSEGVSDTLAR